MKMRASLTASLMLGTILASPAAYAQTVNETESLDVEQPGEEAVDISAPGSSGNMIVVRGQFIPDPVRATAEVVSVLGEAEIARTADGDIAGSFLLRNRCAVLSRLIFFRPVSLHRPWSRKATRPTIPVNLVAVLSTSPPKPRPTSRFSNSAPA
mgnify:CR=1 FL=1